MIADHDRDRQSRDFQNMIVSDRRSWFGKMIVSDRRSRKKVSCLTLSLGYLNDFFHFRHILGLRNIFHMFATFLDYFGDK